MEPLIHFAAWVLICVAIIFAILYLRYKAEKRRWERAYRKYMENIRLNDLKEKDPYSDPLSASPARQGSTSRFHAPACRRGPGKPDRSIGSREPGSISGRGRR